MKYNNNPHLFAQKLSRIMIEKDMVDKKGNPDKVALYNLLYPNDLITTDIKKKDSQFVTDKTRAISNWLNGKNYPKKISDVLFLCNALDCDLDYFFCDMPAPTHDEEFIIKETGLSFRAIAMLKKLLTYRNKYQHRFPGFGDDIEAINTILEFQYERSKKAEKQNGLEAWSMFHYVKQYLSGNYERELQDRLRIRDENIWVDVEIGDTLIKGNEKLRIMQTSAINSKSGSGNNPNTIHVVNTTNPKESYVVKVNELFSSYLKDRIFAELDKIKEYNEKKENNNETT